MRATEMLQLGVVFGFVGTMLLAIAYLAASDVHETGRPPMGRSASKWLIHGGVAAVALSLALEAAVIFVVVYR